MRLTGKVALITGASQGIGAETAKLLAGNGASVIVNYHRNQAAADSVVEEIVRAGGKAEAICSDVQNEAATRQMVEQAVAKFGSIDILVLNAAPPASWQLFTELSLEELETKLLTEVRGYFIPAKIVAKLMIAAKSGCIIGLSSVLAKSPAPGFSAHTTAKSAIEGLLKAMALELAPHGIRVNVVAPSLTVTPGSSWVPQEGVEETVAHTPMGRLCSLQEIASAILMMASDDASFITGACLPVDGGMSGT
ncbi:MAG: SDR family oxidoreductase [Pseudomonadales bacterium]|nr:SDR family oxidoreductase [Pseudomonadales bacterium]